MTGGSGDGTEVTLTFSTAPTPPAIGDLILVSGINPVGYNGYKVVTDSTSTSVTYLASETLPYVSGGIIKPTIPVTNATGNGTTVTLTFATRATAPYPVGSRIAVADVTPAGYNGYKIVTACTTSSVSYASTFDDPYEEGGAIVADLAGAGTGSTVTHLLNFSTSTQTPVFVNKRTDGVGTTFIARRDKTTTALANGDLASVGFSARSNTDTVRNLGFADGVYNASTGNKVQLRVGSNSFPQTYTTTLVSDASGLTVNNNFQTTSSSIKLAANLSSGNAILQADSSDLQYNNKFKVETSNNRVRLNEDLADNNTKIFVADTGGMYTRAMFADTTVGAKIWTGGLTPTYILQVDADDLKVHDTFQTLKTSGEGPTLLLSNDITDTAATIFKVNDTGGLYYYMDGDAKIGIADTTTPPLGTSPATYTYDPATGAETRTSGDAVTTGIAQFKTPVQIPTSLWVDRPGGTLGTNPPALDADAAGALMVFADGDDKGGLFSVIATGGNGLGKNAYTVSVWDGETWRGQQLEGLSDVFLNRTLGTNNNNLQADDLLVYKIPSGGTNGEKYWTNMRPSISLLKHDVKYGQWLGNTTPKPSPLTGGGGDTTLSQGEVLIGRNWTDTNGTVRVVLTNKTLTTDDIQETVQANGDPVINKWYTDARSRSAISAGTGLSYNSSTGAMSLVAAGSMGVLGGIIYGRGLELGGAGQTDVRLATSMLTGIVKPDNVTVEVDEYGTLSVISGSGSNLADLGDVSLTSPAEGDILHYDGTNWVNNPRITHTATSERTIFSNRIGNAGQQAGVTVLKDTAGTAYDDGDGIGLLLGVDSDSQSAKYFANIGGRVDLTSGVHSVRFLTSDNNFSSSTEIFEVNSDRTMLASPLDIKNYASGSFPTGASKGGMIYDSTNNKLTYSVAGSTYDRMVVGVPTSQYSRTSAGVVKFDPSVSPKRFTIDDYTLDSLTDVVITGTPSTGSYVKYDGTNWVNSSEIPLTSSSSIFDLSDVDTLSMGDGGILVWSSAGNKFIGGLKPDLTGPMSGLFGDVSNATPTSGQALIWNTSTGWTPTTLSSTNSFATIAVSGQSSVVADSSTDTLTLVAGSGISITTNATTDEITITNTGSAGSIAFNDLTDVAITSASATSIAIGASQITSGTIDTARVSGSYTGITGVGTLVAGTWNATTIGVGYGGTGLSSYTTGDLVYASGTTTLSKLGIGSVDYVLTSSGTAPQYVAQSTLSVGSATNASNVAVTTGSATTNYLAFVTNTTGNLPVLTNTSLTYNSSTNAITGGISGGTF